MNRREFFDHVFAGTSGLIEIRCRQSRAQLFSRDLDEIENFIKEHLSEDIWFGAATRKREVPPIVDH